MGHYTSEMEMPLSKEEQKVALKYERLEERIRKLPLSCLNVEDMKQVLAFERDGLRFGRRHWDEERAKFWRKKIKLFEKQKRGTPNTQ